MPSPTVLLFVNDREKIPERKIERERENKLNSVLVKYVLHSESCYMRKT